MRHINGNVICAIDIRTNGIDYLKNNIIEVAIIPLDFNLKPDGRYIPFNVNMIPYHISNAKFEKDAVRSDGRDHYYVASITAQLSAKKKGVLPSAAADYLDDWFGDFNFGLYKRFMPLAYDYSVIKPFLRQWLGTHNCEYIFDYRYRDIMSTAMAINDGLYYRHKEAFFAKQDFDYICSTLQISRGTKSCLECAYAVAQAYHDILHLSFTPAMLARL